MNALYMFFAPGVDSTKHRATINTPIGNVFIIGVNSIEEGPSIAKKLVEEEGVAVIELCAGFGYGGAKMVSDEVGDKAAVGMVVCQFLEAPKIAKLMEGM